MYARPPGIRLVRSTVPRIFAAALVLAMTPACEDNGAAEWAFEGRVSHSSLWEYHDRVTALLCPSLLDRLDEHARTVGGKIGLSAEQDRPLRYYRFGTEEELATGCSPGVTACAIGDAALSIEPFHAHEQAHTYVYRAWGTWSVGLLDEGEAVALSCDPFYTSIPGVYPRDALGVGDWRPLLYLYGNSHSGYAAAGFWVTYLARRYGWQKVKELHRRVPLGISADDFAIEFARVFPISMDQAWSEALTTGAGPSCDYGWACNATSMSVGDVAKPDCDGELHRSIEISGQAGVVLTHRRNLIVWNCADPDAPAYELQVGKPASTTHWVSLPAGTYALSSIQAPSEVTFVSYLPSPMIAATCEQAGKVTLQPGQFTSVDLLSGKIDGWLRLDGGDRQYRMWLWNVDVAVAGGVALCESCDARAPCVPVPAQGSTAVTIGTGAVLRLRDAHAVSSPTSPWGKIAFSPAADAGLDAGWDAGSEPPADAGSEPPADAGAEPPADRGA